LPLYITQFSISLGITTLLNFIAIYADLFEASGFWVGMFTTSYTTVQLVTLLPIGWISDRFNKKKNRIWYKAVLVPITDTEVDGTQLRRKLDNN